MVSPEEAIVQAPHPIGEMEEHIETQAAIIRDLREKLMAAEGRILVLEGSLRTAIQVLQRSPAVRDTIWIEDGSLIDCTLCDFLESKLSVEANEKVADNYCLWEDYQADQSYSNLTRWLKHRVYCRISERDRALNYGGEA